MDLHWAWNQSFSIAMLSNSVAGNGRMLLALIESSAEPAAGAMPQRTILEQRLADSRCGK